MAEGDYKTRDPESVQTQLALMRQDMKYMRDDMREVKIQLKEERTVFVTQDQLANAFASRDDDIKDLKAARAAEKESKTFYTRTVITSLVTALISFGFALYLALGVHK